MKENPANGIKDLMWSFLMDRGQNPRKTPKHINWAQLDMLLMSIVIETTALVLSGELDKLEKEEPLEKEGENG